MSEPQVIKHDGEEWRVLAQGARLDGKIYCHLASTTRGAWQKDRFNPAQITDWIDARILYGERLSDRVRAGSEAAPWVVDEIIQLEQERAEMLSALNLCAQVNPFGCTKNAEARDAAKGAIT